MEFAEGLCFYKLICVFVVGAVLGDMLETVACYVRYRKLLSRSSFVYGHMSVVWGFAFVIATLLSHYIKKAGLFHCFVVGTVFGGAYEYLCSLFTEKFLGTKFWDYSKIACNLHGRINLRYCLYWGIAAMFWMKGFYPVLDRAIGKIPIQFGTMICQILLVILVLDGVLSLMAIRRYVDRKKGVDATGRLSDYLDKKFPDHRMERIYPHMKIC